MFANMSLDTESHDHKLTDPRALRALAHPMRLALNELLVREGSLTATQASDLLGESTASTSYHLRQLAKYGFIEEAEGGRGRERPWRPVASGHRWSEVSPDPNVAAAASALSSVLLERELGAVMDWIEGADELPSEWREAAAASVSLRYLTLDELQTFAARYLTLLEECGFGERTRDPSTRPASARPVKLMGFAFPVRPTPTGN
jgi:predicted ArsR family transcriptional regulator